MVAEKGGERRRLWKGRDERTAGMEGVNQPFLEKLATNKLLASSARTPVESHSLSADDDQTLARPSLAMMAICHYVVFIESINEKKATKQRKEICFPGWPWQAATLFVC